MSLSRQLAAIMFADIAGYTAMMQEDEANAMRLRDKFKNSLEKELKLHNGKIIQFKGDGALCSFSSAIEAVWAAIAIQLQMRQDPEVPLRIGIHQADIVFKDGDIIGDGVNVASRLESFALPGSILVSAKVVDDIKNQKDIQLVSLGKYLFKNVTEPVQIFALSNAGLLVPTGRRLSGKGIKYVSDRISFKKRKLLIQAVAVLLLLAALGILIIPPLRNRQYARNTIVPEIQRLVEEYYRPPTRAYDLGLEAEKYIPKDSVLQNLWPAISSLVSITTEPEGADVFWKDYDSPDAPWRSAGKTPLTGARLPRGYLRMEIRKEGFQTIQYAGPSPYERLGPEIATLKLDKIGNLPEGMVRIPESVPTMGIVGLEQEAGKRVGGFLIDKYEVTNKQFKAFIDQGGYTNDMFWKYPLSLNGKEISLTEALRLFVDKTGRQGPANWLAGTYPNGEANHPVTGVSWYEAAAYAAYSGKQLPTIFHWSVVAQTSRTEFIVPLSNYNNEHTVAVGSLDGYSHFGVYDLAGNAREWCHNGSGVSGQRYVLGGGFNDPTYSFNDSYTQSAMDRSLANGFRCIKTFPGDTTMAGLLTDVASLFRDYREEKPVDDHTFALYLKQFNYDSKPLETKVVDRVESDFWRAEKVTFDAGYNNERMLAWIFLPKDSEPPYQPILYFPASNDIYLKEFDPERVRLLDFVIKSGRALVYPVYKGTNDRHDELDSDLQDETVFYKDHVVMWGKETGRTIDFLESRPDIQADKLGYFGWSWGGFMGGIVPAIEKRIKAVVLHVGGMEMNRALPEVDQLNYLPRVTQPILMLNGRHDMFFPVESSQKPMYDLLGTPAANKKHIIYDTGHLVPRVDMVKETLMWFDRYLGPVR